MCSGLELGPGLVGRNPIPRGFRAATPKAKVARAAWEAERRQAARGGGCGASSVSRARHQRKRLGTAYICLYHLCFWESHIPHHLLKGSNVDPV